MSYYGYAGNILYINLTTGDIRKEQLPLDMARSFLGGLGINHRLAYDVIKPKTDPLSPENAIILGAGPFTGTSIPGNSVIMGTTKEPLHGVIASAAGKMRFASMMKWSGYDHIIITGKSSKPAYIEITDEGVNIRDAEDLWGKDIPETTEELWNRYQFSGVIAIGQAGENLVRFAMAIVDKASSFGRGGLGAVMGSKNLKAVVAKGSGPVKVAHPDRLKAAIDQLFERMRRFPGHDKCVQYGIMDSWDDAKYQLACHKNWTEVYPPDKLTRLYGPHIYDKVKKGRLGCPSCFIADKDVLQIPDGKFKGTEFHQASFANLIMIATRLNLDDYHEGMKLLDELDRRGMCLMTFTALLDFLFYLKEKGIISEEDLGGLPAEWGFENIMVWLNEITFRRGFGDTVADGWQATIDRIGRGCEQYAHIIKGRDCLWDPRLVGMGTMQFDQVVCPRGPTSGSAGSATYVVGVPPDRFKSLTRRQGAPPDAMDRIFTPPTGLNIGRLTVYAENWYTLFSSLGLCSRYQNNRFYSMEILSELYSAVTGFEVTPSDLMTAANQNWNMFRVLNMREGFTREDDKIPQQWFQPITGFDGKPATLHDYYNTKLLTKEDVVQWVEDYYDERGWDRQTGMPTKEKLIELGMKDIAEDMARQGFWK